MDAVASEGVTLRVECVSGSPRCGQEPPEPGNARPVDAEYAEVWMAFHLSVTGHRRFSRAVFDTVQWNPPPGTLPDSRQGVTP